MNIKKIFRWVMYAIVTFVTLVFIAALVIRFYIFPNIAEYKDDIADYASNTMQRKVSIGDIQTGWQQLSPRVILKDIHIYDTQNRAALTLKQVDTELSWLSIGLLDLRLSELTAHEPSLTIRRAKDGVFYLAGVNLSGRGNPKLANWLLSQANVGVTNANVIYIDELRQAPELSLKQLNVTLSNSAWKSLFGRHEFKASGMPSVGTNHAIEVNGHFIGRDMSNLKDWYGEIEAITKETDITAWKPWIDYPIDIQTGTGNVESTLHFSNLAIDKVEANVDVQNLSISAPTQSTPLIAQTLSGQLGWSNIKNRQALNAKNVNLTLNTGVKIQSATGLYVQTIKDKKPWIESNISIQQLHLEALKNTASYFSLPTQWRDYIDGMSPKGVITNLKITAQGEKTALKKYALSADFSGLGITSHQKIPGFTNLSGKVFANQDGGELTLNSTQAMLDFKDILRWPIPANELKGKVNWDISENNVYIAANELLITNPHISGTINAQLDTNNAKPSIDLTGRFSKGNAKYALFYYPIILGKSTIHWLDTSILAGRAEDIQLTIKGKLADFPFVDKKNQLDPKLGLFRVTANLSDALVEYGTGWPVIEGLNAKMLFEGKRMEINANKGKITGNTILSSKITIPQLDADSPILNVIGEIEGPVKEGVRFVNESPVKEVAMGFTEHLKTAGDAHLHLELRIPMQDLESANYKGAYQIKNGTLFANEEVGLPELSKLNGVLNFTEHDLNASNIKAEILGGPALLNLTTGKDKIIRVAANGRINDTAIKKLIFNPITNALSGNADWKADITIKKPLSDITISSNLVGMAVNLPAPFDKPAQQSGILSIVKKQSKPESDSFDINYNTVLQAKVLRNEVNGHFEIDRSDVAINTPPQTPVNKGLNLRAKFDTFDADSWTDFYNKFSANATDKSGGNPLAQIHQVDISVETFKALDRELHHLKATAKPTANGLQVGLQSQEITGDIEWLNDNNGKVIAKLKSLSIPNTKNTSKTTAKKDVRRLNRQYPALDITADNFEIGDKKLGALALNAYESGESWVIQKLNITNPDANLSAEGTWHNWTRNPNTFIKFELQTDNIGKALKRFGQADTVKGGKAIFSGGLQWPGSPHEFDASGLNGNLTLNAEKGQILKVQPGVGRLLGLLSLQSLPRRLTLDFRDLFSDGFAFDNISATAVSTNGVLRSNDFFMTGPAAEAKIKGEVNLSRETQNLKIKVTPHVSDTLSLAALAGGPIVGAAAFVAQKILKDPFNKIASSEYTITGTWDNPQELESNKAPEQKPGSASSPLQ